MAGLSLDGIDELEAAIEDVADDHTPDTPGYRVVNPVEYARFVEFGTAPHIITPRSREALRFRSGGTTVFATRVEHPGTAPQPMLRPAVDEAGANMASIARSADTIEQILARTALFIERGAKLRTPVGDTGNLRAAWRTDPL